MSTEMWQVIVNDEIFDGDLEAFKLVAAKGRLQPQDKVRCVGGDWVEAQQVPELRAVFVGMGSLSAAPLTLPALPQTPPEPVISPPEPVGEEVPPAITRPAYSLEMVNVMANPLASCLRHPGVQPAYVCTVCSAMFCKSCIKLVAIPQIGVCSFCGAYCEPFAERRRKVQLWVEQQSGLGLRDLALALAYPFKDPLSMLFLSSLYSFLLVLDPKTLFFFPYVALLGFIIGSVILYSCTSLVIKRVATGNMETSQLFDLNVLMTDPLQGFVSGFGIMLAGFGPLLAIIVAYLFYQLRAAAELGIVPVEWLKHWGMVAAVWTGFYYPVALLVGGYSDSFLAVINPLLGLDTIRRIGLTYVKFFLVYLIGGALCLAVVGLLAMLQFIVTNFLAGILIYFANIALACLLGRVLFKSADKLNISDL